MEVEVNFEEEEYTNIISGEQGVEGLGFWIVWGVDDSILDY